MRSMLLTVLLTVAGLALTAGPTMADTLSVNNPAAIEDSFGLEVLHDNTWGITLDGSNNIYMCGHFQGTIDLDPGPGVDSHSTSGDSDCYVVKLTSDGDYIWGNSWGGPEATLSSVSGYEQYFDHPGVSIFVATGKCSRA